MDYTDDEIKIAFKDRWLDKREETLTLLERTLKLLNAIDVQHIAMAGTLLGIHHYNNFIPWDDDVDILTLDVDGDSLLAKLKAQDPSLNFHLNGKKNVLKVSLDNKHPVHKHKWSWPFIDLAISKKDEVTNDYVHLGNVIKIQKFGKDQVFPIQYRNLDRLLVPVPNDVIQTLVNDYSTICLTSVKASYYDHNNEKAIPKTEFPSIRVDLNRVNTVCDYKKFIGP